MSDLRGRLERVTPPRAHLSPANWYEQTESRTATDKCYHDGLGIR